MIGLLAGAHLLCTSAAQAAAIFVMKVDGSDLRKITQVEGFDGHGSPRFSHDDQRVAFDAGVGSDTTRRLFVVNFDGTGLRTLGAHAMPDWSGDDKQVAYHHIGISSPQNIYVQNLDGAGRVFLVTGSGPRWSPDGSQMAFSNGKAIKLLDLVDGTQWPLADEPFEACGTGFDWSPDGKRLAFVVTRKNQNDLWIASTELAKPQAHVRLTRDMDSTVAWSPDGKRLAVTLDGKIHLLEVDGAKEPEVIPGQEGASRDVAWSHDGQWIAFVNDRKTPGAQVAARTAWKLESARQHTPGVPAYSVAISSDGQRAVLGRHTAKAGFEVWDFATNEMTSHNFPGVFLGLSPDNKTVAGTGLNSRIVLVDLESGKVKRDLLGDGVVLSTIFSKDGTRLASATLNKKAQIWEVATGKSICVFKKHEGYVFRAAFTPDGKEAISGGQDKTLRIWNATSADERLAIPHPEMICAIAVSPDGRQVVTGTGGAMPQNGSMTMEKGADNTLRSWDLASGKLVCEMKGHTHAVYAIDVSADGALAVSGGWDGTVRVWDLQTGEELAQAQIAGSVMDVKFSTDARQMLVGGGATRFAGEPVRYFGNERSRLYQLVQVGKDTAVSGK